MKKFFTVIIFCQFLFLVCNRSYSQSDPKLSIFTYNPIMYNPAYAGSFDGFMINSIYSSQWVGFEGSPKTIFLSGHSVLKNTNTALGLDIMLDQIGPVKENNYNANFAYHFNFTEEIRVSLGIKAGMNSFNVNYNLLTITDPNENDLADKNVLQNSPSIGAGAYLYSEKWALGFSAPNLLNTRYLNEFSRQIANKNPYYFMTGASKITLDNEIYIQPNFITRVTNGAPVETLLSINLNWQNNFFAGINFEMDVSVGGFAAFRFFENFVGGYTYDIGVNDFGKYNGGVHTIILSYRIEDYWSKKKCSCFTF